MPLLSQGATVIHYEERGSGFPLLLVAQGRDELDDRVVGTEKTPSEARR
jgi:hypothetical protein